MPRAHGEIRAVADRECGRHFRRERGHRHTRWRHSHTRRGGDNSGGGHTLARAIDTTKRREFGVDPLQILELGNFNETDDCDSEDTDDRDSEKTEDYHAE